MEIPSTTLSATDTPILLITGAFEYTKDELASLSGELDIDIVFHQNEKEPIDCRIAGRVVATVCNGLFLYNKLSDFPNLRFIQLTSAGHDRIPEKEIIERDIKLCDARGVYSTPMAEWAVAVVLSVYKNLNFFQDNKRTHQWIKDRTLRELDGRKTAIVGAGSVGREVAHRFKAFGCIVDGFDIRPYNSDLFSDIFHIDQLSEYIADYDIIVITAPSTPETYHLFDFEKISCLKNAATLINISRGSLIDQIALTNVLKKRQDLFAALDVFESEPLAAEDEMWNLPNCLVSPHNSFIGNGNHDRMFTVIKNSLISFFSLQS